MFEVYLFVIWSTAYKGGVEIEPMLDMTTCEQVAAAYETFATENIGMWSEIPVTKCVKIES